MSVTNFGEVFFVLLAAGVNNIKINTRIGYHSLSLTSSKENLRTAQQPKEQQEVDGGWNEATAVTIIQRNDCYNFVVMYSPNSDGALLGRRALVRT